MPKKLIVANWKMHPKSAKEAQALFGAIKNGMKGINNAEVVICPPFIQISALGSRLSANGNIKLGAQNCHWEVNGAFTGEISANMLADAGAEYVILGHSERRQFMGETDEIVNLKIKAALKAKLKPILCVGEKAGEEMGAVVGRQLIATLADLSVNQMKDLVIVYEPVWAISTQGGQVCLPDDALSAALFIRRTLTNLYSRFLAEKTPIIYGGSVNSQNASAHILQARMDGLLVGAASLDAEEFVKIIKNVNLKM